MARKYWTCRKCKYRQERTATRKCKGCGELTKPKKRVAAHMVALRDHPFPDYLRINGEIHGAGRECACCGREPVSDRNMDRDHGHDKTELSYGKPRGLLCPGDWGCNRMMSRLTLERARAVVAYLERAEAYWQAQANG